MFNQVPEMPAKETAEPAQMPMVFNLYSPPFLEASEKHQIKSSAETQKKHQNALKQQSDDLKVYKKTNKNDRSLLKVEDQLVVVGSRLGAGAFGIVKSGALAPLGTLIAIKRIFFDPVCSTHKETARERAFLREDFWAEIEALKIMGDYLGHGTRMSRHGEKGYILTRYHPGKDLRKFTSIDAFTFEQALKILLGILSKLRVLHEHDPPYLHNDLNEGNVQIDLSNAETLGVKLMDFGGSRPHGKGSSTFSGEYIHPEMNCRNSEIPRTFAMDIYSFGKVAQHVFRCTDKQNKANADKLEKIINKCLATLPDQRPTITGLEKDINALIPGPVPTSPEPTQVPEVPAPPSLEVIRKIASTSQSKVYEAMHNNERVALKMDIKGNIRTEANYLKKAAHPKIVQYRELIMHESIEYMSMEYMDLGILTAYLKSNNKEGDSKNPQRVSLMRDFLQGLVYLHTTNLIHRDIKCSNIFLSSIDGNLIAKIGDFGFTVEADPLLQEYLSDEDAGTAGYIAPEVYELHTVNKGTKQVHKYTPKADVYGAGVVLLRTACDNKPLVYDKTKHLVTVLRMNREGKLPEIHPEVTEPVRDLILWCFKPLGERPTSAQLLEKYEAIQNENQVKKKTLSNGT